MHQVGWYDYSAAVAHPQGGGPIAVELYTTEFVTKTHAELQAEIAAILEQFTELSGVSVHSSLLAVIAGMGGGGMEYEGGIYTGHDSLRHEIFHQWFARGLKPRHANDGWVDEAWTRYAVDYAGQPVTPRHGRAVGRAVQREPVEAPHPHRVLCDRRQGFRHDHREHRRRRAQAVDAHILRAARAGMFSTAELERPLYCESTHPIIREAFHRFVYGNDGTVPPLPPDYCP